MNHDSSIPLVVARFNGLLSRAAAATMLILGIAGSDALGDYDWADSSVFVLDLRTALGGAAAGWADSPEFVLDLRTVWVGWADSGTFGLDLTRINRGWGDSNIFVIIEPPQPSGDLDDDGDVDEGDFGIFLLTFGRHTGEPQYRAACDYDADGAVTLADYQVWLAYYRAFVGSVSADPPVGAPGDFNADARVDLGDFAALQECLPAPSERAFPCLLKFDFDENGRIDLADFAEFAAVFTGP